MDRRGRPAPDQRSAALAGGRLAWRSATTPIGPELTLRPALQRRPKGACFGAGFQTAAVPTTPTHPRYRAGGASGLCRGSVAEASALALELALDPALSLALPPA